MGYKKILIINPFGIGDVLFTTPVVHTLKDVFIEAGISYLCNSRSAQVLEGNPYIEHIFIYDRDEFEAVRRRSFSEWLKKIAHFAGRIRKEHFDAVFDLSLNKEYGFLSWCAGIKHRIGYDYKKRGFFLNHKIVLDSYQDRHVIEYYGNLLGILKLELKYRAAELYLNKDDRKQADDIIRGNGVVGAGTLVVIAPGGGKSWGRDAGLKHWPARNFAGLADKLIEKKQAAIIIVGDNSDKEIAERVVSSMRAHAVNLCGTTTIRQLAALMDKALLVIANDGGPLHMAVALKKKTVSFFGPVDPRVYGPYPEDNTRHIVLSSGLSCSPCYRNFRLCKCSKNKGCLQDISVDTALQAALKLL